MRHAVSSLATEILLIQHSCYVDKCVNMIFLNHDSAFILSSHCPSYISIPGIKRIFCLIYNYALIVQDLVLYLYSFVTMISGLKSQFAPLFYLL